MHAATLRRTLWHSRTLQRVAPSAAAAASAAASTAATCVPSLCGAAVLFDEQLLQPRHQQLLRRGHALFELRCQLCLLADLAALKMRTPSTALPSSFAGPPMRADVAHLRLAAGVGAASPVDAHWFGYIELCLELLCDRLRPAWQQLRASASRASSLWRCAACACAIMQGAPWHILMQGAKRSNRSRNTHVALHIPPHTHQQQRRTGSSSR